MTTLAATRGHTASAGRMELSLNSLSQLYNSLDASPFYAKDLDAHAEQFILSWVDELPREVALSLVLHLRDGPTSPVQQAEVAHGIHQYFAQRERIAGGRLQALLRQGRISLAIGLGFLASCLVASEAMATIREALWAQLLGQSLTVAGWVAMWRPLEIYLYDWWPLRRRQLDYRRLSRMSVELRAAGKTHG
ncbi:MAG TPA: hypothetical protein VFV11_00150 [Solimonas sp.]|nr:hypothetical protein [Solimonas sp.]